MTQHDGVFGAEFLIETAGARGGSYPLIVNGNDWGSCSYSIDDLCDIAKWF